MDEPQRYFYWSASQQQIVTTGNPPEHYRGSVSVLYHYFDKLEGGYGGHCRGRDLHPLTPLEVMAVSAHPNPRTIMPKPW